MLSGYMHFLNGHDYNCLTLHLQVDKVFWNFSQNGLNTFVWRGGHTAPSVYCAHTEAMGTIFQLA